MKNAINPKPFKETRGRKKRYGFLSKAHDRIIELRYLKECQNAIIENGAFHKHNLNEMLNKHFENPNSTLTEREQKLVVRIFDKRNEIADKMKNDLDEYFKMEKRKNER